VEGSWFVENNNQILEEIRHIKGALKDFLKVLQDIQTKVSDLDSKAGGCATQASLDALAAVVASEEAQLAQLVATFTPSLPTEFELVFSGTTDTTLEDNATGLVSVIPIDNTGAQTMLPSGVVPQLSSSDSTIMDVNQEGVCTNAVPPKLGTVTLTASATLSSGAVITGTSKPITVVPGPPAALDVNVV
jgi:hypothetical protein